MSKLWLIVLCIVVFVWYVTLPSTSEPFKWSVNKQVKQSKKDISDANKVVEKNVNQANESLGISDAIQEIKSFGSQIGQIGEDVQEVISFLTE